MVILVVSSLLVTSRQYIGDPIDCIVDPDIPQNIMDTYCWIHATFTIPNRTVDKIGTEVAHPGVAPSAHEEKQYHKYYQWVCFTLFFQAALFYVPRWVVGGVSKQSHYLFLGTSGNFGTLECLKCLCKTSTFQWLMRIRKKTGRRS